jgi:tRNA 2-thiocytidine biosynthesis protein TtcA
MRPQELPSPRQQRPGGKEAQVLQRTLLGSLGQAIATYDLIRPGDRILVCVSGGKDSLALLHLLLRLQRRSPVPFELVAGHINLGHGTETLEPYFRTLGIDYRFVTRPLQRLAREHCSPGKPVCALCSRFRRAALYDMADEADCNSLALAHHADDLIETVLMSMLFAGQIKSMPARLIADDGQHLLIRPLCLTWEHDLARYAQLLRLPVIPNPECNDRPGTRRRWVKEVLAGALRTHPAVKGNLLRALQNVLPSHLLAFHPHVALGLRDRTDIAHARATTHTRTPKG